MSNPNLSTLDTLVHFRPACLSHLLDTLSRLTMFHYLNQPQHVAEGDMAGRSL
jgi:hypothetical protein